MSLEQTLQNEIQDSKRWIECTPGDSTYKRDFKMNEIVLTINQTHDIFEADKLHSELRIIYHFSSDFVVLSEGTILSIFPYCWLYTTI
jgi:hypothetical protein